MTKARAVPKRGRTVPLVTVAVIVLLAIGSGYAAGVMTSPGGSERGVSDVPRDSESDWHGEFVPELPRACRAALAAAKEAAELLPQALGRLRAAYEASNGAESGMPPEAVFAQSTSAAQGLRARIESERIACEAATR